MRPLRLNGVVHPEVVRRLDRATTGVVAPLAAVDLDAFDRNAAAMAARAHGKPIRLASKSVRVRALIDRALAHSGFSGVMAYALREALWLAEHGATDLLVAYPTVDRAALRDLSRSPYAEHVTVTMDSLEHLDLIESACHGVGAPIRVCIDVDCSLRLGRVHLGVRRSPLRDVDEVRALAVAASARPGIRVVGLMFYDAQIAGLPDSSPAVRTVKALSDRSLRTRRASVVAAVGEVAELEFVNAGGTGSLHLTGADPCVTELAGGSGLLTPGLFDGYRAFRDEPAAFFALPVTRRPARGMVTAFGGGYVASGQPGWSRVPRVAIGQSLRLRREEGTGEVQTPLIGPDADRLALGDRVWMRHAKAGEAFERFDSVHLVSGSDVVERALSYRGEGRNFG